MAVALIVAIALLASKKIHHARAAPISTNNVNTSSCTSFMLPVSVTANNHIYNVPQVNNNTEATSFAVDCDTWDTPPFPERIVKNITISQTYNIHAQLCIPPHGDKKSDLQIATHGLAFDSRYWDSAVEPQQHSYVNAALQAGYSILTYDRLGCGQSSKPDAYTELQAPIEVEVLRMITEHAQNGTLLAHAYDSTPSASQEPTFENIIHVGHSFGSFITYALTSLYPNISDATVLTGLLPGKESNAQRITAFDLQYAPENNPQLFSGSSSGYVVPATQSAIQTNFFSSRVNRTTGIGGLDLNVLEYAYSVRQPNGVTELGSAMTLDLQIPTAPQYKGPVQFLSGEYDFLQCLGDCRNTYDPSELRAMYPMAKDIDIYLQPGTGHALPFHNGAQSGFQQTFNWLAKNGF